MPTPCRPCWTEITEQAVWWPQAGVDDAVTRCLHQQIAADLRALCLQARTDPA
jgi:hypothetical protein